MLVKYVKELDNKHLEFTAELDEEEASFLIEWSINNLIAQGIAPFKEYVDLEELQPPTEAIN